MNNHGHCCTCEQCFPRIAGTLDRLLPGIDYDAYIQSEAWQKRAQEARCRVSYLCQVCNTNGEVLDVHHRTYERLGHEADGDLTVLCRTCHELYEAQRRIPKL